MADRDEFQILQDRVATLEQLVQRQNLRIELLEQQEVKDSSLRKTAPAIPAMPDDKTERPYVQPSEQPYAQPSKQPSTRPYEQLSTPKATPIDNLPRKNINRRPNWNNEHLEAQIGGTWLNRIGVVAFVLGMGFFLKYAFENNWIGPAGRVAIGLLIGIILLTGGELAQKKQYEKFAQGITGGGIAVLYLSIFAAFQFYELIPQLPAFALMILVTATAVLLAVRYSAMAIAILGVTGGFLTPFLLSTGEANAVALFTYIAILDLGILATAYFQNWRVLNYLSYIFTQSVILLWLIETSGEGLWTRQIIFTVFFLIFACLSFFHNILHKKQTQAADLALIFLNAGVFFGLSYFNLEHDYQAFLGLFAALMAIIYFSLGYLTLQANKEDRNLTLTFLGVSLIFLTLAIPIQLTGHWITAGWSAEGAVLLWLGFKTGSIKTRYGAWAVLVLVIIRLLGYDTYLDLYAHYLSPLEGKPPVLYTPFLNAKTLTFLAGIGSFLISAWLYSFNRDKARPWEARAGTILAIVANLLILWLLSSEITAYFDSRRILEYNSRGTFNPGSQSWDNEEAKQLTLSAVWALYSILLVVIGILKKYKPIRIFAIVLFGVTILKVFLFDLSNLDTIYRIMSFLILGVILIGVSFLYQKFKGQMLMLLAVITVTVLGQLAWLPAANADYAAEHWAFRKQIPGQNSSQKYVQVELDGETYNHSAAGNLADLRVVGGNKDAGEEVPYYLYSEKAAVEEKAYPVTILNNSFVPGAYSSFVLDLGEANRPNNRLTIETPGTNFLRRIEVEGADNPKAAWNKLASSDHIFDFKGSRSTQVHYSENNFRYLRIKIWNKSEPPLEITGAMIYYTIKKTGAEKKLEPKRIATSDNVELTVPSGEQGKKSSMLTFDLGYANYPSHRLVLSVADENFSRQVTLEGSNDRKTWEPAGSSLTIYSYNIDNKVGQNLTLEYPEISSRYLRVTIHNQDNPPLHIKGGTVYSFPHKVIFPYDSRIQYALYYGNPKAQPPVYDIQQLATYLEKGNLPVFSLGPEQKNPLYVQEKKPWTEENKWMLWTVLGLVVIVLGLAIINTMKKIGSE